MIYFNKCECDTSTLPKISICILPYRPFVKVLCVQIFLTTHTKYIAVQLFCRPHAVSVFFIYLYEIMFLLIVLIFNQ